MEMFATEPLATIIENTELLTPQFYPAQPFHSPFLFANSMESEQVVFVQQESEWSSSTDSEERAFMHSLLSQKHPLEHRWTLYYCKQDKNKKWEECMLPVHTFDTIEDFWALFIHARKPSFLEAGSDYYVFKEGIQPMWEDPVNRNGGRWLIMIDKNQRETVLDEYWLELLKAMVGEQFGIGTDGEQISGAVVNIRAKGDKISLWTQSAENDGAVLRIGRAMLEKLGVDRIRYEVNNDLKSKQSSVIKPRHILP